MSAVDRGECRYLQRIPNECMCARCGSVYRNPRKLPCGHITCLSCLQEVAGCGRRCHICNSCVDIASVGPCMCWSRIVCHNSVGPRWLRHSLNALKVACLRGSCVFRGTIGEYRRHHCPTNVEDVTDVDVLLEIVVEDPRYPVRIACLRSVCEVYLHELEYDKQLDVIRRMYDVMTNAKWATEVQRIGLQALVDFCRENNPQDCLLDVCDGLEDFLLSLKDVKSLRPLVSCLRGHVPALVNPAADVLLTLGHAHPP